MMTRMTVKDEWVRAAMTDDNVVVELLVRVKQAQVAPPASKSAVVALKWGIRQPRSKPMLMRCDTKRDGDFNVSTRRNPTTPLFWSGGDGATSHSATDGFEETSKQVLHSPLATPSRSKSVAANETTSTTTKRSRRKKTFAELNEDESLLVKEMSYLKKEIASMRATCKEQGARNENLKRIKRDLNLSTAKNEPEEVPFCQPHPSVPSSLDYVMSTLPSHAIDDCKAVLDSCIIRKALLSDLNMMPVEDESGAETLHGSS
ncbi:hypothetical protein Gotri_009454 [Gossypium trilobum]|uniref:Uncharacterized protein n=1 Tax=Gossypium trilobum TaxID=34281 RepID=A0A7J9EMH3_9ROSI|nr:hypothetical protein [Gossypium trilobum]